MKTKLPMKGKYAAGVFPAGFADLPKRVRETCRKIAEEDEKLWTMFVVGKNLWLVSKHQQDPSHFTIIASVVAYESKERYGKCY